jgi:hypothetical protein
MGSRLFKYLLPLALIVPTAVLAKTKVDAGFAFPADKPIKIILFRPDVEVGLVGTSGVPTANPDWTRDARKYLQTAIAANQNTRSNQVVEMPELTGEDGAFVAEYQSLYRAVGSAMVTHNYAAKLPTKKLADGKYKFDWTLGPGAKRLGELGGGNYGLFVFSYDAYATSGRQFMQILVLVASSAAGAGIFPAGGQHISYASLVDLDTGNIVWFNLYTSNKGDMRTADGAIIRADTLLSTLPLKLGEKKGKK